MNDTAFSVASTTRIAARRCARSAAARVCCNRSSRRVALRTPCRSEPPLPRACSAMWVSRTAKPIRAASASGESGRTERGRAHPVSKFSRLWGVSPAPWRGPACSAEFQRDRYRDSRRVGVTAMVCKVFRHSTEPLACRCRQPPCPPRSSLHGAPRPSSRLPSALRPVRAA